MCLCSTRRINSTNELMSSHWNNPTTDQTTVVNIIYIQCTYCIYCAGLVIYFYISSICNICKYSLRESERDVPIILIYGKKLYSTLRYSSMMGESLVQPVLIVPLCLCAVFC